MVIADAAAEKAGEIFADKEFLRGREREGIGRGQIAREFGSHLLGGVAARSEDENGAEIFSERLGDGARPVAADFVRNVKLQRVGENFFERHGAFLVADEGDLAAEALQPFHGVVRIGDAAAEKEELRLGRCEGEGEFVIQAAVGVAEHLIFIHDEQGRAFSANEAALLRFERGDEDGGLEIFREVAGGDADVPAAGAPFGEFVVGERARRDGVNGLAAIFSLLRPEFEDEGFARASRGVDDDITTRAQRGDGLLLPEVGHGDLIERREIWQRVGGARHGATIAEGEGSGMGFSGWGGLCKGRGGVVVLVRSSAFRRSAR